MYIALFGGEIDIKSIDKLLLLLETLSSKGGKFCYYAPFLAFLKKNGIAVPSGDLFDSRENLPMGVEMLLSLGGDGTFLNSISCIRDTGIPVAGINFGRLGFLTSARVSENENQWMSSLIERDYILSPRSLLKLSIEGLTDKFYPYALNEISVQRTSPYMLGVEIKINGGVIPTFWADGFLVSTPTGSTAYSLSVGGPIVAPGSNVFIIAPIAPHNLNIRPIVISDDSHIEINLISKSSNVVLSVDNRSVMIDSSEKMMLSKGDYSVNCIQFSDFGFFAALNEKLLWGEDKRNNA